jgi:hypothetical protein
MTLEIARTVPKTRDMRSVRTFVIPDAVAIGLQGAGNREGVYHDYRR